VTVDEIDEHFEAATNAGDVDAALALYKPAACLVAAPGEPGFRADAIRDVETIQAEDRTSAGPAVATAQRLPPPRSGIDVEH
jgi:hypothetical protein